MFTMFTQELGIAYCLQLFQLKPDVEMFVRRLFVINLGTSVKQLHLLLL